MSEPAALHPASRSHLDVLADGLGIMQHAIRSRPDPAHGYCTDDVARALVVDLLQARELGWPAVADSAWRNLRFLGEAFDPASGRFRNLRRTDGSWLDEPGSEDCHGRAMLALGQTMATQPESTFVMTATALFSAALPAAQTLTALRAQASALLGCDAALRATPARRVTVTARMLAGRLRSTFESTWSSRWPWPEPCLTYENALPAQALIVAGRRLRSRAVVEHGLRTLDWLIEVQTAPAGHFSPIGNGWWPSGGEKAQFDQQPIEAAALLLAAETAWLVTDRPEYRAAAERAYAWFLGENDLGLPIADPGRGACHDGLNPRGVSDNQGAESTLVWLTSLEHIRAIRDGRTASARPTGSMSASPSGRVLAPSAARSTGPLSTVAGDGVLAAATR